MQKKEVKKKVCQHCCSHDDVKIDGANTVICERCGKKWYSSEYSKPYCPSIYPTWPTTDPTWTWYHAGDTGKSNMCSGEEGTLTSTDRVLTGTVKGDKWENGVVIN